MKKYRVDHVCILTKDLDNTIKMFREVFGMEIIHKAGEAPARKVWLDGGIQVNEAADFIVKGGMDHLAINVPEEEHEEVFRKAAEYGCSQVPGMKEFQWIYLPDGQIAELTDFTERHNQE